MNKKLFSWKALAGLALLVAMGLTSCKQDNPVEIDESGSYVIPSKPVTPTAKGTVLSGFKTCTELNNLIAGTKDITDNIGAGKSVTITADCSNLEVTTTDYQVSLPSKTDATINLELTGAFKTKDGAVMEINDQAVDVLNLTLPNADYVFATPLSTVTLNSAINKATISAPESEATPFTVGATGSIAYLNHVKGYIKVLGAITGAIVNDDSYISSKGYQLSSYITNAKGDRVYVKNLRAEKGAAQYYISSWNTDDNDDPIYAIDKVTVAKDADVNASGYITEIAGEGGKMESKVYGNAFRYAAKISDVTTDWNSDVKAVVNKVTFNKGVTVYASASNCIFKESVWVFIWGKKYNSSFTYTFDTCEFADGKYIYASWNDAVTSNPLLDENGNQKTEVTYYYWYLDADLVYHESVEKSSLSEFTEAERKDTNNHFEQRVRKLYTTPTAAYDKDFVATLNLKGCKYAGAAYTKDSTPNLMTSFAKPGEYEWSKNNGSFYASVKYQIDGVNYKVGKIYLEGNTTAYKTVWEKE